MKEIDDNILRKKSIDELTHLFMDNINAQNLKLIEGIESLINEDFDEFKDNMNRVIQTTAEVTIKKAFEARVFKSKKAAFTKADRLKLFQRINAI